MYQHMDQRESIHNLLAKFCTDGTYLHRCNLHYLHKTTLLSIMAKLQNTLVIHSALLYFYYNSSFQDQWKITSDATFSVLVNKSNNYTLFEVHKLVDSYPPFVKLLQNFYFTNRRVFYPIYWAIFSSKNYPDNFKKKKDQVTQF